MVFNATLNGTAGDDNLFFTNPNEVKLQSSLFEGNDSLRAEIDSVGSFISGDQGRDTIQLASPPALFGLADLLATTVRGGDGDDIILINDASNQINLLQNSFFIGNTGNDTLELVEVNDIVDSTIRGGAGNDSVIVEAGTIIQGMISNGNEDNDFLEYFAPVINASSMYGGIGDDTLIVTGPGAQISNSLVSGDAGNDVILGTFAVSSSTVRGGDGNDTIFVSDVTGSSTVIGNTGNDIISALVNEDEAVVRGGEGQDSIVVGLNTSLVNGNQGNDTIIIGIGSDGPDIGSVFGGTGNDIINSGGGSTYAQVIGNEGSDTLNDAGGNNWFLYNYGDTQLTGISGADTITGFDSDPAGTADRIQLGSGDIKFNIAGLSGGITINSKAVLTGGVSNLLQFVEAGASLTTAGAVIAVNAATIGAPTGFAFISDGDGVRNSGDLLIGLDQPIIGLTLFQGDIVSLV